MSKGNMIVSIIGVVGSYASLAGLILAMKPVTSGLNTFEILWLIIWLFPSSYAAIVIYRQYVAMNPKVYQSIEEVNQYMFNWISKGGKVAICTRDMSWSDGANIRPLLFLKAKRNELCIVLPKHTDLSIELKNAGAEIYTYEELEHTPTCRFTIVDKDKDYARVAVGRKINNQHIIEEFSLGSHPVFSVANDLVEVLKKYNEKVKRG
ncbi:Hypothetical protein LUCI_0826 [Lucifera butyrica]|uniref:Uncharacterized protein n=1 Tax=Lucifera butyrica TaxID=1351585 RepID=A0A498QZJ1_9FIRM|nr:hypothetical protein [Lucifera butyrica]VBB05616.1 Hypothetical protein LUCI_0826 [Lucifera butyrica]